MTMHEYRKLSHLKMKECKIKNESKELNDLIKTKSVS